MACCLPLGFVAAAGFAGAAVLLDRLRPWLMMLSAALLLVGTLQLWRRPRACRPPSRISLTVFWICAAIVVALWVAPQTLAGLLADLG